MGNDSVWGFVMTRYSYVFLCLGFLGNALSAADSIVAKVNGESINASEVDQLLSQLPPSTTPLTATQKKQIRLETVSVLVDEKLIRQFLKQKSIMVDASEVNKQLAGLEATLREQGKTKAAYYRETGLNDDKVKDNFSLMLQLAKYLDSQITDEKLKAFYDENRDFFEQTTVRASHIVIRLTPNSTSEERQQAKSKLTAVRSEILAKKITFAEAAKKNSQCPSAPKGGDIGFIGRKFQVDEAFAKCAFELKTGEISEVVESDLGCHLILASERKQGKPVKFEDISREVRDCFEAELRQNLLASLRKKASVEILLK